MFFSTIALRRDLHKTFKRLFAAHLPAGAIVYDIGCGQKPFAPFLKGKVKSHIGVDLTDGFYNPGQVDLIGTAFAVPAPDECADAIISSQVLEHLETPLAATGEAYRLLKPGGLMFLSFPFLYPLHAQPRDYLRYTEFYLEKEIAGESFDIVALERIGGFWYLAGMYFNLYIQQCLVFNKFHIVKAVTFLSSLVFRTLHLTEEGVLRLAKKDPASFRSPWTVNYICVLRKRG